MIVRNSFFIILSLFLSISSLATSQEEITQLDSNQAEYDGKKITLSGDVTVEHELGSMSANRAILLPASPEKKIRFGFIKLHDNVKIALKDGGQLTCSFADINYQSLKGGFFGGPQQDFVVYMDALRDKTSNEVRSIVLKSKEMSVQILREEIKTAEAKSKISNIMAEQNVTVDYNHDFIAASDYAMYQRTPPAEGESAISMPGLISLRAAETNGVCQITNRNGDLIKAGQIGIDTTKKLLTFVFPRGALVSIRDGEKNERIDFSADAMYWDDVSDVLTLRDHVVISQKGLGKLSGDQEVKIFQHKAEGKKQLKEIESLGKTVLTFMDEDSKMSHTLRCYERVYIDNLHLEAYLSSPLDPQGVVIEGKQVFFQDDYGEIFADKVRVQYTIVDHEIQPNKVYLDGNVQIFNRYSGEPELSGRLVQYALSDSVEFTPKTQEMLFKSSEGRRVLFYDKANNLQVSAPALKITRNPSSNKESIQGIGDVRFSFIEHEFEQLRKRFDLHKEVKAEAAAEKEISQQE
jgi:lipopolysaccharide export system protein LptA